MEVVCLRFSAKNDFKSKGKDLVGEIEFPLRGAVRKYDKPNGIFQSFPLKNGTDKVGEALLFIEYVDPRPFSGPSDVQHKGHVGITSAGGFEIRDIPQEWKQLFRVLNIKKKDLENNSEMAQEVFNIMNKAVSEGVIPGSQQGATNGEAETHVHVQPERTVQTSNVSVSAPPPVPSGGGPKPPPPPPSGGGPKPPPPPANAGPKPPTPPAPEQNASSLPPSNGGSSGGGGSIFDQLKTVQLKKANISDVEKGNASTGNPLADTLLTAMSKYRVDIAGKDDDGDDWSD